MVIISHLTSSYQGENRVEGGKNRPMLSGGFDLLNKVGGGAV
jgi:hypothetical protein